MWVVSLSRDRVSQRVAASDLNCWSMVAVHTDKLLMTDEHIDDWIVIQYVGGGHSE